MNDGGRSIYDQLAAPFAPSELEWRVGQSGLTKDGKPYAKVLVYITARAARRRLNEVVGPANWKVEYGQGPANGVVATLSIRFGEEWIAKQDGANTTDIEATKGGISDAFKRACAVWGIGEYLYGAGESWADFNDKGSESSKIEGKFYKWNPPTLKAPALPKLAAGVVAHFEGVAKSAPLPSGVTRGPDPELVAKLTELETLLANAVFIDEERDAMIQAATSVKKAEKAIARVQATIQERESALADLDREAMVSDMFDGVRRVEE